MQRLRNSIQGTVAWRRCCGYELRARQATLKFSTVVLLFDFLTAAADDRLGGTAEVDHYMARDLAQCEIACARIDRSDRQRGRGSGPTVTAECLLADNSAMRPRKDNRPSGRQLHLQHWRLGRWRLSRAGNGGKGTPPEAALAVLVSELLRS